ncbi:MAG: flagellar basal-body MS-ring/collar protein FliF [candidate division Zixibacteria bacterium]|nr:flagellar basal-body MS-ring/collar protein FliF [candidate division Zixibacteria bacterium]MDH3937979.1 flagellar basal-body MS-ring/collar protein FliF [candidate division Zixibacteria bacterium]MDH4033163.1 flagellar basal-body MS-ring/collar protein FliF [candidate division Zixibacteria bacterium]
MEALKEYLKNISGFVGRMSPSQVMMLLGVITGTLVGVVFLVGWLNTVTYEPLYSDLDEAEAGEVVAYLGQNNIDYQLTSGGRTIEVPSSDVYQARIGLATQGLPRSGSIGYSLFDENNLGMTDFLQNLNFRRALEGELTRTIMQLREVDAARVHIVIPKDRLFKEDQKEATASVVLKLRGSGLGKPQVAGISHLVASSVEGLSPDNITIVDYNGNLLSSGQQNDALAGLTASQMEVGQNVEKHLESKAQTMLDEVLGVKKSVVRVTAELNFQQLERTSEIFDPNAPSIRSEQRTQNSGSVTDRNEENAESSEEDAQETVITNYELNRTMDHIVNAVGTIERLSVAVLVDGNYSEVENADGVVETVYEPRSPEELDRLEAIVKNAIGYDSERNDQVEMLNLSFDRKNLDTDREALDAMYVREFYLEIAKKVGYVLLIAFLLLYLKKKSRKLFGALSGLMPPPPPPRTQAVTPEPVEEEPIEIIPETRKPRLVDKMQETAKKEPEEIAKVIKTMMIE